MNSKFRLRWLRRRRRLTKLAYLKSNKNLGNCLIELYSGDIALDCFGTEKKAVPFTNLPILLK